MGQKGLRWWGQPWPAKKTTDSETGSTGVQVQQVRDGADEFLGGGARCAGQIRLGSHF